jgi:hypothetical protein
MDDLDEGLLALEYTILRDEAHGLETYSKSSEIKVG